MGIFSRTRDIIAANMTDLLDRAEDPAKMIRMIILSLSRRDQKENLIRGPKPKRNDRKEPYPTKNKILKQKNTKTKLTKSEIAQSRPNNTPSKSET